MGKLVEHDFYKRGVKGEHWYNEMNKREPIDEREFAAQERANKVFVAFCGLMLIACVIALIALSA